MPDSFQYKKLSTATIRVDKTTVGSVDVVWLAIDRSTGENPSEESIAAKEM